MATSAVDTGLFISVQTRCSICSTRYRQYLRASGMDASFTGRKDAEQVKREIVHDTALMHFDVGGYTARPFTDKVRAICKHMVQA